MKINSKFMKKITAVTSAALMAASSVIASPIANVTVNAAGGGDDYARLLQYSLYFYDANYCGADAGELSRLTWRGGCHANDEVAGGFHDAGDHVKFGLPAGYTASNLGWSYYEFGDSFDYTGQTDHLRTITDHFAEFFKNSTTLSGNTVVDFVYQVGEGGPDHDLWGPPETANDSHIRTVSRTSNGASDIAAQYAAALALNYINFRNEDDLVYAKALYDFSVKYNNKADVGFYPSGSLDDDQAWAAGWLYLATEESYYKNECASKRPPIYWYNNWDNNALGANCVYGYVTGDWSQALNYLRGVCSGSDYRFADGWGSARHNVELQFCALVASRNTETDFSSWAKGQMDYIIGNKGVGNAPERCYVVGFADNSVKYPHHRGGSGFTSMNEFQNCDGSYSANGHILPGALVGGPTDPNGAYTDSVKDYQSNEVALDYNVGLVGAAAGLYAMYGTGSTVPSSEIPDVKSGTEDPGPVVTRPVTTATKRPVVTTTTVPVIITHGSHKLSSDRIHSVNSGDQWENWYWNEFGIEKNETVTKVEVELEAVSGNIGDWQGAFGTTSRTGDWIQTSNFSYNFGSSGIVTWEISETDSARINFDTGELKFGTWWSSSQNFAIKSVTVYTNSTEPVTTTTKPTTTTTTKPTTTTTKPTTTTTKKLTTTTTKPTTTTTKKLTTTTTKPTTTTTKKLTTTTTKPTTTTTKKLTTTTTKPTTTTTKKLTTTTTKPTTTTTKKLTTTTTKPTTTTTKKLTTTTTKPTTTTTKKLTTTTTKPATTTTKKLTTTTTKPTTTTTKKLTTTTTKPTTTTTKKLTTTTTKLTTTTTKKLTTTTTKPATTTTKKLTTTTTKPTTTTTKKLTTTTTKPTTTTTKKLTTTTTKPTTTTTKKLTTTTTKPTTTTTKKLTTTTTKPITTKPVTTTTTAPAKLKGDVNDDGKISIADLVALQYYLLGRDKLDKSAFPVADLNDDSRIDVFDFILLRKIIISKIQ